MEVADQLYGAGLRYYALALHAAGQFERVVLEVTDEVVSLDKQAAFAKALGVEKLQGRGASLDRPNVTQMRDTTISNFWAWSGKQFWAENVGLIFFGLLVSKGSPYASVAFSGSRRAFRDSLHEALKESDLKLKESDLKWYYDKSSGETVVQKSLAESKRVQDFQNALSSLIDAVVDALSHSPVGRT